jgi:tetratricopeptide (TPR) repeat protein
MKLVPFIIASDTTSYIAYEEAGLVCVYAGDTQNAKKYFQRSIDLNPSLLTDAFTFAPIGLADILLKEGKKIDAEILLSRSLSLCLDEIQKGKQDDEFRMNVAAIRTIQGKKEDALSWMQKAIDVKWQEYGLAEISPWFKNINGDARFLQMINSVKAEVNQMRIKSEQE